MRRRMETEGKCDLPSARRNVYDAILAHPGVSVSEIARHTGMFWTSVALHVAHLERTGLVRTVRLGRRRVIFPHTALVSAGGADIALLSEPACLVVARAIVEHPDRRVWELSDITGMSERAVYHHAKRLVEAGLVDTRKAGAYRGLRPTPRLLSWIGRGGPPP